MSSTGIAGRLAGGLLLCVGAWSSAAAQEVAVTAPAPAPIPAPGDLPALIPPGVPDDWTPERLGFPLGFAPEIPFEGYEDLRFAPGMFTEGAPDAWSYILTLHLTNEPRLDAAALRDFLLAYYKGLARATLGERTLDLETISADVRRAGDVFVGEIRTFDTFVTGEAMTLQVELSVAAMAGATQVLGLVSPAADESDIWGTLRTLGEAWRAARPAPAYLNHLYIVPDAETYAALEASDFLEAMSVSEQRHTVRADLEYTGLYVYGDETYFEFLKPDPDAGFVPGGTGLAFGFEQMGGTALQAGRLQDAGIQIFAGERTRALGGEALPWFQIMGVQAATLSQRLSVFSLEYDPTFLARWHADLPPTGGGLSRAAVLTRYAAALGRLEQRDELPLGDVVEVRLNLAEAERARLLETCRVLGYTITEGNARVDVTGPRYRIVIWPSDSAGGITGFDVSLRRPVEAQRLEFGSLAVELKDGLASFEWGGA